MGGVFMTIEKIRRFFQKTYVSYYILFIIPSLIFLTGITIISVLNFHYSKNQIQTVISSSLKQTIEMSERNIHSIINSASFFDSNPVFLDGLNSYKTDENVSELLSGTLNGFKSGNEYIDSVFLVDNNDNTVLSDSALYPSAEFFEKNYSYESYPASYWIKYRFLNSSVNRILAPTVVHHGGKEKVITPIIIKNVRSLRANVYILINVNINMMFDFGESSQITPNTQFYLLNRYNGEIFNARNGSYYKNIITDTELYSKLTGKDNTFYYDYDKYGKCMISFYSTSDSIIGYSYFTVIPMMDIYKMQSKSVIFSGITALILILISLYVASLNTKRAIKPLKKAVSVLSDDESAANDDNIIGLLNSSAEHIRHENEQLTRTLPFAQEKFLMNYINSTDYMMDKESQQALLSSLGFTLDCFAVATIQLYPTSLYFETFSINEYQNFQIMFHSIISEIFNESFDAFVFAFENSAHYIVLNVEEGCRVADIQKVLEQITDLLKNDMDYINIYVGNSEIHKGLEGLKMANGEIRNSLKMVSDDGEKLDAPVKSSHRRQSVFTDRSSDELYNALIAFKADTALNLIKSYVAQEGNADVHALKELYAQILQVIINAMRIHDMSIDNNKMYFEIYTQILTRSTDEIYKAILGLVNNFSKYSEKNAKSSGFGKIVEYIDANFSDPNISLDSISEAFNISPSYISTMMKTNLGVGFSKYLSGRRITKAKHLLKESDKRIEEIHAMCGFSSKQTFFRVFKASTGVSPGEYRKNIN